MWAGRAWRTVLGQSDLIDEYRPYVHPVVFGQGAPFFAGPPPALRPVAHDLITERIIRLTYAPAD